MEFERRKQKFIFSAVAGESDDKLNGYIAPINCTYRQHSVNRTVAIKYREMKK